MDTIGIRLREERNKLGLSQTEFALLGGVSKPSQVRYENGGRNPDSNYLSEISKHGADIMYILIGNSEAHAIAGISTNNSEVAEFKKILNMGNDALRQTVDGTTAEEKEAVQQAIAATREFWKDQAAAIRKHYTFVNLHEIQASAGSGYINGHEDQPSALAFSNLWLKRIGLNPDATSLIYVAGDSMEPTLKDGSIVLIDHQLREPIGKHIYAIRNGDELMVKRLEKPDDKTLLLTSDNPKYATKVLTGFDLDAVGIVGKVVWSAFTLDD